MFLRLRREAHLGLVHQEFLQQSFPVLNIHGLTTRKLRLDLTLQRNQMLVRLPSQQLGYFRFHDGRGLDADLLALLVALNAVFTYDHHILRKLVIHSGCVMEVNVPSRNQDCSLTSLEPSSFGYPRGVRQSVPETGSGDMVNTRTLVTGKGEAYVENVVWFVEVDLHAGRIEVEFAFFVGVRIGVAKVQSKEVNGSRSPLLDPDNSPLPFLVQLEVVVLCEPLGHLGGLVQPLHLDLLLFTKSLFSFSVRSPLV